MRALLEERSLSPAVVVAATQIATSAFDTGSQWVLPDSAVVDFGGGAGKSTSTAASASASTTSAAATSVAATTTIATTTTTTATTSATTAAAATASDAGGAGRATAPAHALPIVFRDGLLGRCQHSREQVLLERLTELGLKAVQLVLQVRAACDAHAK